ncbi:hypothetical protein M9458_020187, partial [Cirrhinus mrigala]
QSVATVEEGEEMKFNVVKEVQGEQEIQAHFTLPLVEEQGENNLILPTGRLLRTPSEKSHHSSDGTES